MKILLCGDICICDSADVVKEKKLTNYLMT